MVGAQVSHYRIVRPLGAGGMGEVFLAHDLNLDRPVALKFLSAVHVTDPQARKRLLQEAHAVAALDHPFICKAYEVGEFEERPFIAMEYVDGVTLEDLLEKGRLPLPEALRLASEIAEAVDAAHRRGIVHRDLKPANVMVRTDGHVKVMDFGIAKRLPGAGAADRVTETALTAAGNTTGTLAWMSPEQLRGETVDARSDVFAFGVLLYEMITGVHPFLRSSDTATTAAILGDAHAPVGRHVEDPPPLLEHLITRLLAKNPELRHQSLRETRIELQAIANPDRRAAKPGPHRPVRTRRILTAVAVLAGVAAGAGLWAGLWPFDLVEPAVAFRERDWVLIADVENLTGDPVFDRTLRMALEVGIGQSKYVNVMPRDRLTGALQRMQRTNVDRIDEALAAEIAVREGTVRAVLVSSIAEVGAVYALAVRVIDPATRAAVLNESVQAHGKDKVLEALDELSVRVRRKLGESLDDLSRQHVPLPAATTSSLEALRLYADSLRTVRDSAASTEMLRQALKLDPDFALAHAELGRRHYLDAERASREIGEQHFTRALSLLDRLSLRERLWIAASAEDVRGNRERAAESFASYLSQYPDDGRAWFRLGWTYMAGLGRYKDAIDAFNRVTALNPAEAGAYVNLASCHSGLHQNDKAVELYEKALTLRPEFRTDPIINHEFGFTLAELGRLDAAAALFEEMKAAPGPVQKARGARSSALLNMYRGRYATAIQELRRAIALDQSNKAAVSEYRDRLILATALEARGLTSEATAELAAVDRLAAGMSLGPEWLRMAASIRARRGDRAAARRLLAEMERNAGNPTADSSINRNAQREQAYLAMARAEIEMAEGRPEAAVRLLENVHLLLKDPDALDALARAYAAAGRLDDAAARFEELLKYPPLGREIQEGWLRAHVSLAQIRERQGRRDDARQLYERLLALWKDAEGGAVLLTQARTGASRV